MKTHLTMTAKSLYNYSLKRHITSNHLKTLCNQDIGETWHIEPTPERDETLFETLANCKTCLKKAKTIRETQE